MAERGLTEAEAAKRRKSMRAQPAAGRKGEGDFSRFAAQLKDAAYFYSSGGGRSVHGSGGMGRYCDYTGCRPVKWCDRRAAGGKGAKGAGSAEKSYGTTCAGVPGRGNTGNREPAAGSGGSGNSENRMPDPGGYPSDRICEFESGRVSAHRGICSCFEEKRRSGLPVLLCDLWAGRPVLWKPQGWILQLAGLLLL